MDRRGLRPLRTAHCTPAGKTRVEKVGPAGLLGLSLFSFNFILNAEN